MTDPHSHSHSCHGEHDHGDHSHSHGAGDHDHSGKLVPTLTSYKKGTNSPNQTDDLTPALQYSLYQHVEFDKITTLNESVEGSGASVVKKSWDERLDTTRVLESDVDEQLLMLIPFTGSIKLHSILLRSDSSPTAPKTLKLYLNRNDLDFSAVSDLPATQTLELPLIGQVIEMPVKRALFNNCHCLTLFFESNHSGGEDDVTRISYLGFKGTWTELKKEAVVANYEAAANPADHKNMVPGANYGALGMGGHNQGF